MGRRAIPGKRPAAVHRRADAGRDPGGTDPVPDRQRHGRLRHRQRGRFPAKDLLPYIVAQTLGAILAARILFQIASGTAGFAIDNNAAGAFATNGFNAFSPGGYSMTAAFLCEVVMTAMFLAIILGATHKNAAPGFAPIAIGLGLTLIHLISIPVTNTSVNPARSTGVALLVGGTPLSQLWLFWAAPIIGGVLGGVVYKWLGKD